MDGRESHQRRFLGDFCALKGKGKSLGEVLLGFLSLRREGKSPEKVPWAFLSLKCKEKSVGRFLGVFCAPEEEKGHQGRLVWGF